MASEGDASEGGALDYDQLQERVELLQMLLENERAKSASLEKMLTAKKTRDREAASAAAVSVSPQAMRPPVLVTPATVMERDAGGRQEKEKEASINTLLATIDRFKDENHQLTEEAQRLTEENDQLRLKLMHEQSEKEQRGEKGGSDSGELRRLARQLRACEICLEEAIAERGTWQRQAELLQKQLEQLQQQGRGRTLSPRAAAAKGPAALVAADSRPMWRHAGISPTRRPHPSTFCSPVPAAQQPTATSAATTHRATTWHTKRPQQQPEQAAAAVEKGCRSLSANARPMKSPFRGGTASSSSGGNPKAIPGSPPRPQPRQPKQAVGGGTEVPLAAAPVAEPQRPPARGSSNRKGGGEASSLYASAPLSNDIPKLVHRR